MSQKKGKADAKSEMQVEAAVEFLIKKGVLNISSKDDRKKRENMIDLEKVKYHNTKLLLQKYREIAWTLEVFPEHVEEELDGRFADLDRILEHVDLELVMGNRKLEARLSSIAKTRLLFDRLNEAISLVKKNPVCGKEMYEVIYHTYIGEATDSIYDLFERLGLSKFKYYDLLNRAQNIISIRLWSSPDSKVDLWLDVLEYFQSENT